MLINYKKRSINTLHLYMSVNLSKAILTKQTNILEQTNGFCVDDDAVTMGDENRRKKLNHCTTAQQ